MALTDNMKAFAHAKVQGKSNKDSALDAGYSEKSAGSKGSQLAKDPEVVAYLAALLNQGGEGVEAFESMPLGEAAINAELEEMESVENSLDFLKSVYKDPRRKLADRITAAKAALPFEHGKVGEKGIKQSRDDEAADVADHDDDFGTAESQLKSREQRVS